MSWRTALIALVALVLQAQPALAGSVSVDAGTLRFQAAPGEANNLTLLFSDSDGSYIVSDTAPISVGPGCAEEGGGARCPGAGVAAVSLDLGDGDDHGNAAGGPAPITMHGGSGNDELTGVGTLFGDAGDDYLIGSDKPDVFSGGPGHDWIEAQRDDTLDCQGDDDEVVKPSAKPSLVNCSGAPSVTVKATHVTVRQLLAGKMRLNISCAPACAYRFFSKAPPSLKRVLHHGGDDLAARPISLDDAGFLRTARAWKTNAHVSGPSTQKALSRLRRFKLNIVVDAYTGQNQLTEKIVPIRIG